MRKARLARKGEIKTLSEGEIEKARTENEFFEAPATMRMKQIKETEARLGYGVPAESADRYGMRFNEALERAKSDFEKPETGFGAKFAVSYAKTYADMMEKAPECRECTRKLHDLLWDEIDALDKRFPTRAPITATQFQQAKDAVKNLREVLGFG
jgi:hypothetical protein